MLFIFEITLGIVIRNYSFIYDIAWQCADRARFDAAYLRAIPDLCALQLLQDTISRLVNRSGALVPNRGIACYVGRSRRLVVRMN